MSKPLLVIISGPPCTGKTTISHRLSEELRLPLVSKDGIKELLFESLGWLDRERSRQLGRATYNLLYYFVEAQLSAGISHIVESNFTLESSTPNFLSLLKKYSFTPLQVQCRTDGAVLVQRFKERSASGKRHPGHVDHLNYEELSETLKRGWYEPLPIGGRVLHVDTTDFNSIDYAHLTGQIRQDL